MKNLKTSDKSTSAQHSQTAENLSKSGGWLQAWTLSEVLVMMLLAGIVFVGVMEGMGLFNRAASQKTAQIADDLQFVADYCNTRDSLRRAAPDIDSLIIKQLKDAEEPYKYE